MPEITIGAPRNAVTDPESGLRYYNWQGQKLVSVTSARRMAGLPFGLHNWAIGQVINYAIAHVYDIADRLDAVASTTGAGEPLQADIDAELALIKSELRGAATAERDAAARLGTAVHDAAAANMLPENVIPELQPRLRQFRNWLDTSGAQIIASEFQIFNLSKGYAGTCDFICQMRDGSVYVVDLKTGKGVYNDHALQVTAYANGEFAGQDDVVDDNLTAWLKAATGLAILHLADDGWEFLKLKDATEMGSWRAFQALLLFSEWTAEHSTTESFTSASRSGHAPAVDGELAPIPAPESQQPAAAELAAPAQPEPASPAAVAEMMAEAGPVLLLDNGALMPDGTYTTAWCIDFSAHQTSHRQIREGEWVCDICFAAQNAEGIVPAGSSDSRLSPDEFKSMVRAGGIDTTFLMTTARELWPQVADMRLLDDSQRGALWQVIAERWAVQHA